MTKSWIGLSVAAVTLAVSVSMCFACGEQAQAADAKGVKTADAKSDAKGCDMPCCAHANAAANDKNAANTAGEKPCAAHEAKGCPKKAGTAAATVTKAEPAKDTANAEPAVDPGTNR